jgi:hypothetical protein
MSSKYHWYEKLFFRLQLRERRYFRLVFVMITVLMLMQILLTNKIIRHYLVLVERLEGEPAKFYQSLKTNGL